uniref:Uncharacterized protein n=1 Tax=Rhizophora mucronata TaxID=61149 RepID=A0A2P2QB97_RHIMU
MPNQSYFLQIFL